MHRARTVLQAGWDRGDVSTGSEGAPTGALALDHALAGLLEGGPLQDVEPAGLLQHCRVHGVSALVADALRKQGVDLAAVPGFQETLNAHALFDRLHRERLNEVLDALQHASVECLLLKGTPVAHLYYPSPALRSRGDTDLLVDPADFERIAEILEALGYDRQLDAGGELSSYQASFECSDGVGCRHVFDVHRRISNRQVFARAFPVRELWENSAPLPRIHPHARTLTPTYLLLHACLHRVAHLDAPYRVDALEHHGDRLVWLLDVALIARRLSEADWHRLTELAGAKGMAQVLLQGLENARALFPFDIPLDVTDRLREAHGEPSARLLERGGVSVLYEDIRNVGGWRERLRLLIELAVPPPDYMYARHGARSRLMLPWWYLRRGIGGLLKQFQT